VARDGCKGKGGTPAFAIPLLAFYCEREKLSFCETLK